MPLMNEAVSKENFELMERGQRPKKPTVEPKSDPAMPVIEQIVKVSDIRENYTVKLEQAFRSTKKNVDGVRFIGFEVLIELSPIIPKERGPGRPPEQKTLMGWMQEGEFLSLLRKYSKQIDRQVIRW